MELKKYNQKIFLCLENLIKNTDKNIVTAFTCLICTNIKIKPIKCGNRECEYTFYKKCIEIHLLNSNSCSNCRRTPFTKESIGIYLKNKLFDLNFKCH